jgi:hypothetical protein
MNIFENLKNKENLRFIEIETSTEHIKWLLDEILNHPTSKLFYINNFIENNYINLLNYNEFLENTQKESNKIIIIKEYSHVALKNPFIMAQKYDYIHFYHKITDLSITLQNIILSFDVLKIGGILHITISCKPDIESLKFIIDYFLICYSNKSEIIINTCEEIAIKKIN